MRINEYAKDYLCAYMLELSQQYWGCTWHDGLDKILWNAVEQDTPWIPDRTKAKLRRLRKYAGGWWIWDNGLKFKDLDHCTY